jgi:cobalamin-dependent methionine synthase I
VYDEIEPDLKKACEDVILNRNNENNEATEKLLHLQKLLNKKANRKRKMTRGVMQQLKNVKAFIGKWDHRFY